MVGERLKGWASRNKVRIIEAIERQCRSWESRALGREMNSTPRRRVEKKGHPSRRSRTLAARIRANTHTHTHKSLPYEMAGAAGRMITLERRFVNTLEKMRGVLREDARKGGLWGMAGWFVPGGKRSGILLRARSGIYLPPIALGSRLWKVNELRSPSLSSPFSLLLLLSRLQNCEQCNFFCQRLLAFGLPRGILCACTLSTTLLSNAFVIWHKSWVFF